MAFYYILSISRSAPLLFGRLSVRLHLEDFQERLVIKKGEFLHYSRGKKASFLGGHELLLVHCVSKQALILIPKGLPCVQLQCREVHVSFADSLTIRRIVAMLSLLTNLEEMILLRERSSQYTL
jgi:hypothetical protein